MENFFRARGAKHALASLGLLKLAAEPEFGTAMYENIISSTGDEGRTRHRSNEDPAAQAGTYFNEHDRHVRRDPHNAAYVLPVGLGQSMNTKMAKARALQDRIKFRNLDISIENRRGSIRHWQDPHSGKSGDTKMKWPYGYIRMSKGMDGDHIDCFVGPNKQAKFVYVILTNKAPSFVMEDEQKCMLGFSSAEEAKRIFLQHYNNKKFFKSMRIMPYEEFEKKVLATLHGAAKKVASNIYDSDENTTNTGTTHNQVPGDFLGLPQSSLVGLRSIKGDDMAPDDKIDRMFRFHDEPTSTRVLEGNSASLPESPGV